MRNPFTPADFEAFIAERQRTILEAIETLLIKERLDLSPQLRELDEQTEKVELGIRDAVATVLDNDPEQLPAHVSQKVNGRIQQALRRNAALDSDYLETLAGKLEYCDLRELQDTIVAKSLWPKFTPCFGSKEITILRFDQLAQLRNGIRHSRSVDEITRKEGEVSILWFQGVLAA